MSNNAPQGNPNNYPTPPRPTNTLPKNLQKQPDKPKKKMNKWLRALIWLISILLTICIVIGVGIFGLFVTINTMADKDGSNINDIIADNEKLQRQSIMVDNKGTPIAYFYDQRRIPVKSNQINNNLKNALVSIEDRRFYDHGGVDYKGTIRALWSNFSGGETQGGSTINQQLIKNLRLLTAETDEERKKATEQTYTRKAVEARLAQDLDGKLNKDQILTTYLNVVPFGNHSYGAEVAAQTYFGIPASKLNIQQSAMLAGMVRASEYYNPYTKPDEVKTRRDTVIKAMESNGKITPIESEKAINSPLGVLKKPAIPAEGCTGATASNGFFCSYVIGELERSGITDKMVKTGGLRIETTLDPDIQAKAVSNIKTQVNPQQENVAGVMNVIRPGKQSHDIVAMASSRNYGVDAKKKETVVSLPFSQVGDGAGSTFKIFTAAAALEKGIGVKTVLPSPSRIEVSGMGTGGAAGCSPGKYCVENAGKYAPTMSLQEALAQSPNTTFVKLAEFAGNDNVIDMSVRLGLRSYGGPKGVAADMKKKKAGAYTLGFTAVDPLEMTNVSATLASSGMWCEPRGVTKVIDRNDKPKKLAIKPCEQAVAPDLADSLADGMSDDVKHGTVSASAKAMGYNAPLAGKTGTTENHKSAAFVGFNNKIASFSYVFSDGNKTQPVCTNPARVCSYGDIYGGNEPGKAVIGLLNSIPEGKGIIPAAKNPYIKGSPSSNIPNVKGMTAEEATDLLSGLGFKVTVNGPGYDAKVTNQSVTGPSLPGVEVTLRTKAEKKDEPKPTSKPDKPEENAVPKPKPGPTVTNKPEPPITAEPTTPDVPDVTVEPPVETTSPSEPDVTVENEPDATVE